MNSAIEEPADDLPTNARTLYLEARDVLPYSRRASAALIRAALESCLKELDPQLGRPNLAERIGALNNRVSTSLWQLLTVIRFLGNKTLHEGESDESLVILYLEGEAAEIVEPIFTSINQLVDELVTRPQIAERAYLQIPESVRASAEQFGTPASGE